MLHATIMAGGSGTRFWPESRHARPKQLLRMVGDKTMIRATVDRLGKLVAPERILIATTAALVDQIAAELPELPRAAILAEPCKRNTAPCIGLAAIHVLRRDPEATMAVMPADHVIAAEAAFQATIRFAAALVDERPERIVTFGIRPTYPAEVFGYIERGGALESEDTPSGQAAAGAEAPKVYRVARFHEKPKSKVATEYVRAGRFYWNSGIFVWKARTILDALARYEPEIHARLRRIADALDASAGDDVLRREFAAMKNISIDYAVMERAGDVCVVEATFDWDDVGSWQALARLRGVDAEGNTISGKHLGLSTTGTIVRSSDDHLVVTLGLKDCIVVHTPDATLVADKHDEESLRKVAEMLQERGLTDYL